MELMRGIVLRANGTAQWVEWNDGNNLRHMQVAVGGLVEYVSVAKGLDMWANEESLIRDMPENDTAEALLWVFGVRNRIFGDVLLLAGSDATGATLPLTNETLKTWPVLARLLVSQALIDGAREFEAAL